MADLVLSQANDRIDFAINSEAYRRRFAARRGTCSRGCGAVAALIRFRVATGRPDFRLNPTCADQLSMAAVTALTGPWVAQMETNVGQTSLQRRFDWTAFLQVRKRARQSASEPNLYGGAQRPEPLRRFTPSPPSTRRGSVPLPDSVPGFHRPSVSPGECDLE